MITFPYSTCINSFFGSIIPISLFILKCFFVLVYIYDEDFSQLYDKCGARAARQLYNYVCSASGPAKGPFKCATRKRRTGQ